MTVVIASELTRSQHTPNLIDTCRQVTDVIVVHTVDGRPDVPGCVNLRDPRRHYAAWINTGLDAAPDGPVLVLNDDVLLTVENIATILDHALRADLVVVPNTHKRAVTPISGWCFAVNGERLDETYQWFYSDDDLWERVVAANGRITVVPGDTVTHERDKRPRYPAEFATAIPHDRILFARRWRAGDDASLPFGDV